MAKNKFVFRFDGTAPHRYRLISDLQTPHFFCGSHHIIYHHHIYHHHGENKIDLDSPPVGVCY
jgi:hypothetical protein